jgi:hypothetical protein
MPIISQNFILIKIKTFLLSNKVTLFGIPVWLGETLIGLGVLGKNLTNAEYSHLKFDLINLFGMLQDFKAEARQVGIDVRYEF